MAVWIVLMTDRSEVSVNVADNLPEGRADRFARTVAGSDAFAARPEGCTGFAYNIHMGAEQACPIHRVAVGNTA